MKDNFSTGSKAYANYRPSYPDEMVSYIADLAPRKNVVWDCATGSGQLAIKLADHFDKVIATDISANQLSHASNKENIIYSIAAAEQTDFASNFFDMITVAQAIHWFQFDQFYKEVNRCLKDDGVLAVVGYGKVRVKVEIDKIIDDFYCNVIGKYWDAERKFIDEEYRTIPFPFVELKAPRFDNVYTWSLDDLTAYLNTWSAVKHYINTTGENPMEALTASLKNVWPPDGFEQIHFPIFMRIGRKKPTVK